MSSQVNDGNRVIDAYREESPRDTRGGHGTKSKIFAVRERQRRLAPRSRSKHKKEWDKPCQRIAE